MSALSQRSLIPLLALAALVPVALSLHAKTVSRTSSPMVAAPRSEASAPPVTPPPPTASSRRAAPAPGTLASSLADHPPSREASKAPTAAEWHEADGLNVDGEPRCVAHRVREWLRLSCSIERTQQIALLGGKRDGATFGIRRGSSNDWWGATKDELVMPLRPGDHRVIAVTTAEMGRYSAGGPVSEVLISEQWLDGESPVVVFQ